MFEQSMMDAPRRKPWMFSVATVFQCSLVGAAFLVPMLKIEALPAVKLTCQCTPPPKGVQLVDARPVRASEPRNSGSPFRTTRVFQPRPFAAPTSIPQGIPQVIDEAVPDIGGGGGGPSAPFGVPDGIGALPSTYSGPPHVAPPPAAPKPEPPRARAEAPRVVRAGGVVRQPRLIHEVRPPYPPLARQARIQGVVKLEAILTTDGTVQALRVAGGHPLLVQAAVDAVRQWRYEPTLLNGDPVAVSLSIDVNFTLSQ